jgi:hypothetical protein
LGNDEWQINLCSGGVEVGNRKLRELSPRGGCYEIQNGKMEKLGDFAKFQKLRFKWG